MGRVAGRDGAADSVARGCWQGGLEGCAIASGDGKTTIAGQIKILVANIAVVELHKRVGREAPHCYIAIGIAAEIVLQASIWVVGRGESVPVWSLCGPCLTGATEGCSVHRATVKKVLIVVHTAC